MPEDGLHPDELIEQLVPDPANTPSVVGLDGYVGRSDRVGHFRLYRTLSLDYWLEIREDAVYFARTVDVAGKFQRMSVVWIYSDAQVQPRITGTDDQALLDFLNGTFAAGNLTEVELPGDYTSETGLWCNNLQGTIRHVKRPFTKCY